MTKVCNGSKLLSGRWVNVTVGRASGRNSERGYGGGRWGESLCLLNIRGLGVVEVVGAALGVVVRNVAGGSVQVEVAAARAAGGEAADGTATPALSKHTTHRK